jgi:uncharacterized protein (TIGR04255 family)
VHEPTPKLKYPAVVEAVCEIRFSTAQSYSIVAGAMRERVKTKFPHLETLAPAMLMGGIPDNLITVAVPHHRFKSDHPNAMVQTGPNVLTINILPVYPSFEQFRELITFALDAYRSVAEPGPVVRAGLRYVNHIPAPAKDGRITDYLNVQVSYPDALPHPSQELSARLLFSYGATGTLSWAVAFPARVGKGDLGALLDLDFSLAAPATLDLAQFTDWLIEAHAIIYKAFVSTVPESEMKRMRGE